MPLQKNHPVPLYYQLVEELHGQIESGQLQVGEQIPSVRELARRYLISPMTVRQALSELVQQGLLEIRRGIGTFVASPKLTYDLLRLTGFTEDMRSRGLTTRSRLLHLALETPTEAIAGELQIPLDERVVCIERLRFSGETPAALDQSYLPSSLCAGLEEEDLEHNSLYALLEGRYQLTLHRASSWMEATSASAYEAKLLGIGVGAPMIVLHGITYLSDDRPIERFKTVYRGDCFRFRLEAVRSRQEE